MHFKQPGRSKHWQLPFLLLVAVTLVAFFANVPNAEALSSARLKLVQSDTSRIILELEVSGYDTRNVTVNGATYSFYTIGDLGRTDETGKPQLPVKGTMVGIPPGAQASLRIINDQTQTSSALRHPLPVPTARIQAQPVSANSRQPVSSSVTGSYTPNAATYSANQFYPAASAKIGSTGDWRSQHYVTVQFYPLQYNPATRQLVLHRRVRVEITLSYPRGQSPQTVGSFLNQGAFEPALQNSIINYSSAKNWRTKPAAPARRAPKADPGACPNSTGPCYKIGVEADGIYKVTCDSLATAAGGTLNITASQLQLFKNGSEAAIKVVGSGWGSCTTGDTSDYILFFGQAPNAKYTTTNVYWLTYVNAVAGARMTTRDGTPGIGTPATSFTQTVHLERNLRYGFESPRDQEFEHWYWDGFYSAVPLHSYAFTPSFITTTAMMPTFKFDLIGSSNPQGNFAIAHHAQVDLNSCATIVNTNWSGYTEQNSTVPLSPSCLLAGTNTFTVTELFDVGNSDDALYSNYFDVSYQSTFNAISDTIRFKQMVNSTWQYQIDNFGVAAIELYDIANPSNVVQITNGTVSGSYSIQFSDTAPTTREYLGLTTAQYKTPSVIRDTPSNLASATNGADYVIISHGSFTSTVTPLKNLRATQFSRTSLIDV